jgi:hypothetical protein
VQSFLQPYQGFFSIVFSIFHAHDNGPMKWWQWSILRVMTGWANENGPVCMKCAAQMTKAALSKHYISCEPC